MDIKELVARLTDAPGTVRPRLRTARRIPKPKAASTISIIIPAHNEEAYLGATLAALRRQKFPGSEVIVVANGCTDRTEDVAREHCDRLVVLSQKNLGVARNLGARMAGGELLVFLDADTLLEKGALRTISENFTSRHAAGTVKGRPDSSRMAYRLIYGLKNFVHRSCIHKGSSGVIICWKKHFIRLGGFKESLEVRENSDLIRRLMQFGRYAYIGRTAAVTSMRRYERRGVGRMVWLWIRLWFESLFKDLQHRKYETIR
ncbi:MAG TPA: glycosyltransferase [Candidatus Paceibacterota bacterium]|nr:glycosyltransferase [Candidatus Paceibacterota bacterium]